MGWKHAASIVVAALLASCTSEVEPLTPAQRQAVAEYIRETAPTPSHRLDVAIGKRVELLGYEVDRAEWRPGETMRVTWYWRVLAPPGSEAALFTRIEDPDSARRLDQNGNGTLRWLYGPERWLAGQYVRDVQDLHLPEDWSGESALIHVGFSNVDEVGVRAFSMPTPAAEGAGAVASVPTLRVSKTTESPRIDGDLSDPIWTHADATPTFVETRDGGPAAFEAFAKALWDKRYLYVALDVSDSLLRATDTERDSHLWKQDCVELMIDPDGDGRGYFEIQVSPRGVVFDTRYDTRRRPEPFGHVEWDSAARVGVSARGGLDDRDRDAGYSVEIAIPWQAFSLDGDRPTSPETGEHWRANFYVMDSTADGQRASAWSPLGVGDFHVPRRFGILAFEGTPEEMQGTREAKTMDPSRAPAPLERKPAYQRNVRDVLIRERARRRSLEPQGGGH
jgi:hypothetical protein